jgi:hypothetical protein
MTAIFIGRRPSAPIIANLHAVLDLFAPKFQAEFSFRGHPFDISRGRDDIHTRASRDAAGRSG